MQATEFGDLRRKSKLSALSLLATQYDDNQDIEWPTLSTSENRLRAELPASCTSCGFPTVSQTKDPSKNSKLDVNWLESESLNENDRFPRLSGANHDGVSPTFMWHEFSADLELRKSSKVCCPITRDDRQHEDWRDLL